MRNGQNINIWNDNWTGVGPLRTLLVGPLQDSDANLKINDLRDNNNTWHFDRLSFPLSTSLRDVIYASPHSYNSSQEDSPFWLLSSNGQFLTSSAYNITINLELKHSITTSTNWIWLWKLSTFPRITTFLWLACKDRLPTLSLLAKRNIITSATYPLCNAPYETSLHILRDCPRVRPIWLGCGSNLAPSFSLLTPLTLGLRTSLVLTKQYLSTPLSLGKMLST